jgi:hypothetical protein
LGKVPCYLFLSFASVPARLINRKSSQLSHQPKKLFLFVSFFFFIISSAALVATSQTLLSKSEHRIHSINFSLI